MELPELQARLSTLQAERARVSDEWRRQDSQLRAHIETLSGRIQEAKHQRLPAQMRHLTLSKEWGQDRSPRIPETRVKVFDI